MRTLRILGSVAVAAVAIVLLPGTALASTSHGTKTVSWVTGIAPGAPAPPTGANDVTWPQTQLDGYPTCGTVIQTDTYRYSTKEQRATVDALIAHGTLNKPGSAHWTDTAVVLSWKFTVEDACPTTTPSPTSTPTPTVSPTPSVTPSENPSPSDVASASMSHAPTYPPSSPTLPPGTLPTPPASVLPTVAVSSPSPTVAPSLPATPSTPPVKTLPFTGFPWLRAIQLACSLTILGLLLVLLAMLRRRKS